MLYLERLAPSSKQTMRYVLQDAADRLGVEDVTIDEFPWHHLQPGHITALVAALRTDGYAPNTSSLYVNAIRGVMNQAWQQSLITQDHLLKIRAVKAGGGTRLSKGRNLRRSLIRELMEVCAADPRPQGLRDAAIIAILYGSGMRKSESVNIELSQVNVTERSLQVLGKGNKELIKFAPAWAFEKLDAWLQFRRANLPEGSVTMSFCSIAFVEATTSPASALPNTRFTTSPNSAASRWASTSCPTTFVAHSLPA